MTSITSIVATGQGRALARSYKAIMPDNIMRRRMALPPAPEIGAGALRSGIVVAAGALAGERRNG